MNTNTMELNLNEMAMVTGGDAVDHVRGAVCGGFLCGIGGLVVGGVVGGAPGLVIGMVGGAVAGGTAGGILGMKKILSWFD